MNIHKFNAKPKTISPKTIHWRPLREVKYPAIKEGVALFTRFLSIIV